MMRTLIAIAALVLLHACSTLTPPPSTHPTWCNKDPAKEPHFHDCNGNIYLPGHEPEECIPEKAAEPVVRKPVEPPKPDPIIGVYTCHNFLFSGGGLMRVYPNNKVDPESMGALTQWKKNGDSYNFYIRGQLYNWESKKYVRVPPIRAFIATYTDAEGELNLTAVDWEVQYPDLEFDDYTANGPREAKYYAVECIKRSNDPDHLFDYYELRTVQARTGEPPTDPTAWVCINKGRKDKRIGNRYLLRVNDWSDSLAGCEEICEKHVRGRKNYTCPQDRR